MNLGKTIIVGGGIIGLSTAIHLAKRGVKNITILERHYIGGGQSGRAAGILRSLVRDARVASWLRYTQVYCQDIANDFGIGEGINERGYLLLMCNNQETAAQQTLEAAIKGGGIGIERVTPSEAQKLQPGVRHDDDTIYLWEKGALQCDPMLLTQTLNRLARSSGVEIIENCQVDDLIISNNKIVGVQADGERMEAENVFVATSNLGQPLLARYGIDVPVYPHRVEMAFFHVPASGAFSLSRCVSDSKSLVYLRPEVGNQIFVGWREGDIVKNLDDLESVDPENYKQTMNNATLQKMRQSVLTTCPEMKDGFVHRTYACVYDWTDDEMPILDGNDTIKGLYFTLGNSGGGLSLSAAMGNLMADFIVDEKKSPDIEMVRLSRFAEGQPIDWHNTSR
jgi:glycine/D-amino acid oxidase-like deaminating enzyme